MSIIPRHLSDFLLAWKNRPTRKPLIITGARQVGKTSLIAEFAKLYPQFVSLNLEIPSHKVIFEEIEEIEPLVQRIFLEAGTRLDKTPTLVFIDEIQTSVKAIKQLRFFYEKYPQIHVIAAGSLLEHALHRVQSFPVGRVEYAVLHPLNFSEFLIGLEERVLHEAFQQIPVPAIAHSRLKTLFHRYAIIGGMPEIVETYSAVKDMSSLSSIYESIVTGYKDDVVKYAKSKAEERLLIHAIDSSPHEAGKRIKFAGFGSSDYRSREMGETLRSLEKTRLINLIYPTTMTALPPSPDKKKSPMLQFLDTGLINYALGLQSRMIGIEDLNHIHRGLIIEHLVRQEIFSVHHEPSFELSFWVRQKPTSVAETDGVLSLDGYLIPVEIKSGSAGHLRSIHEFIDACPHGYAIRVYGEEFSVHTATTSRGKKFHLMNVPYYLGSRLQLYAQWFIGSYPPNP